jgi:hypothetical protein
LVSPNRLFNQIPGAKTKKPPTGLKPDLQTRLSSLLNDECDVAESAVVIMAISGLYSLFRWSEKPAFDPENGTWPEAESS